MDDLLIYIRALFVPVPPSLPDAILLAAFQSAGAKTVSVLTPRQRTEPAYPRLILDGDEGAQMNFGENARPKIFDGHVRLEIVTRKSDSDPQPLATLRAIQARISDLLLGNLLLGLPGVKGQQISANYNVTQFREVRPTGLIPPRTDTTVERWRATYAAQLNRLGF